MHFVGDLLFDFGSDRRVSGFGGSRFGRRGQVRRLQGLGNHIIRQPERRARVDRKRREIDAIISIPGVAYPTPTIGNRCGPRVINPSIVCGRVVVCGRINAQWNSIPDIGLVETVIGDPVHVVRPLNERCTAVAVGTLNIAAIPVGYDNRVIRPLPYHGSDPPRSVTDIHALGVNAANLAMRAAGDVAVGRVRGGDSRAGAIGGLAYGRRGSVRIGWHCPTTTRSCRAGRCGRG